MATTNSRVITDARTIALLEKYVQNEKAMTSSEKRELYELLKEKASSTTELDSKYIYKKAGGGTEEVSIPNARLTQWSQLPLTGEVGGAAQTTATSNGSVVVSSEQIQTELAQGVNGPRDGIQTSHITNQTNQVFAENDYTSWLLATANKVCRADTQQPQIPTSIVAAIAMARSGNTSNGLGQYNFWNLPYDQSLTSVARASNYCDFNSADEAMIAIIKLLRTPKYAGALAKLQATMDLTSNEDKIEAMKLILMALDANAAVAQLDKATAAFNKYKMYEWDSNKTEAQGGHADTTAQSSEALKKMGGTVAKGVTKLNKTKQDKGCGLLLTPLGPDWTRVEMLPLGKTYCEPIYPDLILVGDYVPDWVFTESYAQQAKAAEEAALKAAGIVVLSDEEIQLQYQEEKIAAFKDGQFAIWCQKNGVAYATPTEKEEALQKYKEAAAADPTNFTDDVYTPDANSKSVYKALLREKADIMYNGDTATAGAHLRYLEAAQSVKADIAQREAGWNQNRGTYSAISGQPTGGTTTTYSSNASIEAMISWATSTADDQSHGYSQDNRTGPDYDCSSFVSYALDAGGFKVIEANGGYPCDADSIWNALSSLGGWERYNYSDVNSNILRGDILIRAGSHAAIAIDSNKTVEASGVNSGQGSPETGDQGREIDYYSVEGRSWDYVLRYKEAYTTITTTGQPGVSYTTVSATGFKLMNGGGYGTYWIGQSGATSWAGAQSKTLNAMDVLGQWFYNKTGCPLIITAVTNGSHASGEHSHGTGWKFDCNDYGSGAEGTLTTDSFGKGTLTDELLKFGTSIGLGMNWEAPGTNNVHIDVSAWGDQWCDFEGHTLPETINHGGLRE